MKYLAITAILCLILAGASFAGNVTVTEVVTGGNLTLTMPEAFSLSGITVGGSSSQSATGDATYTIEDSRGTGAGWNLGAQISQFVTAGTPQRTIATDKFLMSSYYNNITAVYGQAKDLTGGPDVEGGGSYSYITSSEHKLFHANTDYGMGKYTINITHRLDIVAETYAGTYTATLTATLNNMP